MKPTWVFILAFLLLTNHSQMVFGTPMPEFTATSAESWLNSKPLTKADLKGKVVLLEVWTSI